MATVSVPSGAAFPPDTATRASTRMVSPARNFLSMRPSSIARPPLGEYTHQDSAFSACTTGHFVCQGKVTSVSQQLLSSDEKTLEALFWTQAIKSGAALDRGRRAASRQTC